MLKQKKTYIIPEIITNGIAAHQETEEPDQELVLGDQTTLDENLQAKILIKSDTTNKTFDITGEDIYGNTVSEVLTISGTSSPFQSASENYYNLVTSISTGEINSGCSAQWSVYFQTSLIHAPDVSLFPFEYTLATINNGASYNFEYTFDDVYGDEVLWIPLSSTETTPTQVRYTVVTQRIRLSLTIFSAGEVIVYTVQGG